MGRPSIGTRAMTAAERQQRRRKILDAEKSVVVRKAQRAKRRAEEAERYIPYPPGVTYWHKVNVAVQDEREILVWRPETRPLAACQASIENEDVLALLRQLGRMAAVRGILPTAEQAFRDGVESRKDPMASGGFMVFEAARGPEK